MVQLISSSIKGSNGRQMAVDIRFDDEHTNQPVILFIHGFKGFKDWGHFPKIGDELASAGFAFISLNFSHDGTTLANSQDFADLEAFGNNNYSKELFDVEQVIEGISSGNLFSDVAFDRETIVLFGHSRGGGIAVVKASENPKVKGLITWASVGDLKRTSADLTQWEQDGVVYVPNARTNQQMPMYYQFVEDFMANENRFNLQKCCKEITVPSLFVHGKTDGTVPFSASEQLAKWCSNAELCLVENGDHTFGGKHPYNESDLPEHTKEALDKTIEYLMLFK
ncbi:alpha/beta hydrolase family protein [Bacteroidota bacterium]